MFTIGVFQDAAWAERGVMALLADGFPADGISIIAKRSTEAAALIERLGSTGDDLELRGLGQVVASGPLLEQLQGTEKALESRGLAATVGRAGFQSHDGYIYEALVGRGGVLVAVTSIPRAADALAKLHAFGAGNAAIGAWAGRV